MDLMEIVAHSLWSHNGTWQAFQDDWKLQCDEVGEPFDDYAPDITEILRKIAAGEAEQTAINKSSVCGIREGDEGRFWAVAMLNWVKQLPGTNEPTLRVRHLLASPRLDFGAEDSEKYAKVLVGALFGILTVAREHYAVRHLRLHLRSPEDARFFTAVGTGLSGSSLFEKVETRGAWLYITLGEGDSDSDSQAEA